MKIQHIQVSRNQKTFSLTNLQQKTPTHPQHPPYHFAKETETNKQTNKKKNQNKTEQNKVKTPTLGAVQKEALTIL